MVAMTKRLEEVSLYPNVQNKENSSVIMFNSSQDPFSIVKHIDCSGIDLTFFTFQNNSTRVTVSAMTG